MKLTQEQVTEEIKNGKSFSKGRDDKKEVLEAIKYYGLDIYYASERLRDDKEVVLEAIKKNGAALQYASEKLRNDKGLVLEAIKKDGWVLRFASERLKKELLPQVLISLNYKGSVEPIELVKHDGVFLSLLTKKDKNNKEIVLEAIKQNKSSFVYASQEIRDKIRNSNHVRYLEQWIKSEEQKNFLNQKLDKKDKSSKIKL